MAGGKSDQLNAHNVLRGTPAFFAADPARYQQATRNSVRDAARNLIRYDRRVVLSVVPRGRKELALAGSDPVAVSRCARTAHASLPSALTRPSCFRPLSGTGLVTGSTSAQWSTRACRS